MKAQRYLEKYLKEHCPLQEKKDIATLDIREKDLIGSLDLTGFTSLKTIICSKNKISSLNIKQCSKLEILDCSHNRISSLNLNGLTNLSMLSCDNNYLSSLKLTGCSKLLVLACFNNYLTKLDFLNELSCKKLRELSIDNNRFVKDDLTPFDLTPFSRFVNLEKLQLGNWNPGKEGKRHNRFTGPTDPLEGLIKLEVFDAENTDIELRKLPKNVKIILCSSPKDKQLKEQATKIETPPKSSNS